MQKQISYYSLYALVILFCFPALLTAGNSSPDKINIYVVNYPLKYFTERIAGDYAEVIFPAPADVDPAYWQPDIETIAEYQQADLILLNGAKYAKWTEKISLPQLKVVDTSATFKDRYINNDEITTHTHGPEGGHAHESLAFTIWLDFDLAAQQCKEIKKVLSRKKPELEAIFKKNCEALENELLGIDQSIQEIISKAQDKPMMASHPVYDYFAAGYRLNIKSVHWEPDEVPGDAQMFELQQILKEHPTAWMIWEGEPDKASVEKLKRMGVESIVFDPCGNSPDEGDFMSVMKENVDQLRLAFK